MYGCLFWHVNWVWDTVTSLVHILINMLARTSSAALLLIVQHQSSNSENVWTVLVKVWPMRLMKWLTLLHTCIFFLQMTAAYTSTMTDSKLNKKKQFTDPSFGEYIVSFPNHPTSSLIAYCNVSYNHL